MIQVESNHCHIVAESISGRREADEQTFASLEILSERLEGLKKRDKIFSQVGFSPAVEELTSHKDVAALC